MTDLVVLSAEEHFESLREAVWARFCARHRSLDRDRFDDLYAEWWAREVERACKGAPSRAAAPAAFVAEAVHRVLLDDVRARARGLGRGDKNSLDIVDLDAQLDTAAADDTAAAASYEALAHRILTLVRGSLSERETRVFVWSYLYLQPSERTAEALGLSLPRVKKDRKKIAGKVGARVWAVLGGELDLCEAYSEQSLPAIFEILTVHVEDCPTCSAALGGVRRGALAVIGPELLVLGTASTEGATHVFADLFSSVSARFYGVMHRSAETLTALPPNGRTAAAVAVAATAVAGGAATVVPDRGRDASAKRQASVERRAEPRPTAVAVAPAATAVATTPPPPAPVATARPAATPRTTRTTRPPAKTAPAPAAPAATTAPVVEQEITFEEQAPAPTAAPASQSGSASAPTQPTDTTEFGFEQP